MKQLKITTTMMLMVLLLPMSQAEARQKTRARQQIATYAIGFYNLENLFDTCHDEGKNDYEFLPDGTYQWTTEKYTNKLRNISRVLAELGTDTLSQVGCAVIGVAEVENDRCLTDLIAQPPLKKRGYRFVHIEGPDQRGIDCALLYQPRLFQIRDTKLVPYRYLLPQDSLRATRGFLVVSGTLADEHVTVVVCHLPSRGAESYYREAGGRQLHALRDSLVAADPEVKLLIMGDMNDDPQDVSMADCLGGRRQASDVAAGDMYNPFWEMLAKGTGTLMFQGAWNLFDQILVSPSLLTCQACGAGGKMCSATPKLRYNGCQVFRRDYLIQQDGQYAGSPLRTHGSGQWLNGYSDHLPTVVYLKK